MVLLNLSGGFDDIMGNWQYIDDIIDESQLFSQKSNDFESTGTKISVVLPADKRLRLIRAVLEPVSHERDSNYCYADILFGGLDIGSIYYGNVGGKDTEERRDVLLHCDGIRELKVDITSIKGEFAVRLEGYFIDGTTHRPHKPLRISAIPISSDDIQITTDAPEDNGGLPLLKLEWFRTKTPQDNLSWKLIYTLTNIPQKGADILFVDGSLDDNEEYFYKCRGVNSKGAGEFSSVISARTAIDHPHPITNLTTTPYNSTQIKLSWSNPDDTGGVPQKGTRIEMSTFADSGFETILEDTGNPNSHHIVTGLDAGTKYYFRVYAINQPGKESLIPSNVASATPLYAAPANLAITTTHDNMAAQLSWDKPADTNNIPIQKSKIFRRLGDSGSFALVGEIIGDAISYEDYTIQGNKVYEYYVVYVIDGIESLPSAVSIVNIPIRAPLPPVNLRVTILSERLAQIQWDAPADNGGLPITGYDALISTDSVEPKIHSHGNITNLLVDQLLPGVTYYFAVRARNSLYIGANSIIVNATTLKKLFGDSAKDITVSEGQTITIGDKEYHSITNHGTIITTASIIRCERYTQGESGKILVEPTGCAGGLKGTTTPGIGGAGGSYTISPDRGLPGKPGGISEKTQPTNATMCTDLNVMAGIIDDSLIVDAFASKFKNNIIGGVGSDGTAAQESGDGGHGGSGYYIRKSGPDLRGFGRDGGDGGRAADGADGVRGGGKLALYIRNITDKITILANGINGIDGNKGTGAQSSVLSCTGNGCAGWSAGDTASEHGTLGSKGSQGGIVFLVYDDIPDESGITVDVSGGFGGYHGADADSENNTTQQRADSGDDGVFVYRRHQELSLQ